MPSQLYLFDCDRQVAIAVPTQPESVVIGRDSILQCNDNRISRTHGTLRLDGEEDGQIQITSTHSNPIFIRTGLDGVLNILARDCTAKLAGGDKFALLPDQYWYEVRFGEIPTSEVTSTGPTLRVRTMEEVNSGPIPEEVSSGEKRKSGDDSEADCAKKLRTEEAEAVVTSNQEAAPEVATEEPATTSSDVGSEAAGTVIKPDPDATEGSSSTKSPDDQQPPAVEVKKESADSTGPPLRPSCQFGIACYRHTADHRTQFAHPHDSDYRRPALPPAPDDAPDCPFGASCYRRNPQHFREYKHPDSSEYEATVTPVNVVHVPVAQVQLPPLQPRRRNQFARDVLMAAIINGGGIGADDDTESDDDDDGGSLFGSDGFDSDEYRPGADDGLDDDDDDDAGGGFGRSDSDVESDAEQDEE